MAGRNDRKPIVTYAMLLDLAHDQIISMITLPLQMPSDANQWTAIVHCTLTVEKDGKTRVFCGTGDAAPFNSELAMQKCLPRFAETRAKARALRDYLNISDAAAEEMTGFAAGAASPGRGGGTRSAGTTAGSRNTTDQKCPCGAPPGAVHATACTALRVAAA